LPNARFKDAELLVNWVRIVKSPQEIRYLQEAGQIVERMLARALETIAPGVRECDVIGALYQAADERYAAVRRCLQHQPDVFLPRRAGRRAARNLERSPVAPGRANQLEMAGVRHR
jgi:hypothetical protein